MDNGSGELRAVRLQDLPVSSLLAVRRQLDDLLHEFRIIGSGMTTGTLDTSVPRRLAGLIEEMNERFSSERLVTRRVVDEAAERGDETVTIEVMLPTAAAGAVEHYIQLLDEADDYCRSGELLTLALPPHLMEFRRRVLEDVLRQLR